MAQVRSKGERLRRKLREALGHNPHVQEVRGLGLICGVQLDVVRTRLTICTIDSCPSCITPRCMLGLSVWLATSVHILEQARVHEGRLQVQWWA